MAIETIMTLLEEFYSENNKTNDYLDFILDKLDDISNQANLNLNDYPTDEDLLKAINEIEDSSLKEQFINIHSDALTLIDDNNQLQDIINHFQGKLDIRGLTLLETLEDKYISNRQGIYATNNLLEKFFIVETNKDKNVKIMDIDFSYANYLVAFTYLDKLNYYEKKEAYDKRLISEYENDPFKKEIIDYTIKYTNKAVSYNPFNHKAQFEKIQPYIIFRKMDDFYNENKNIYQYLYSEAGLARYYRNLGFYYIEKEKYLLAQACFIYSTLFEETKIAENELKYLVAIDKYEPITNEKQMFDILKDNEIPLSISINNQQLLKKFVNDPKSTIDPDLVEDVKELIALYDDLNATINKMYPENKLN